MGGRSSSFGKHAGGVTGLGALPELQGSEKQMPLYRGLKTILCK